MDTINWLKPHGLQGFRQLDTPSTTLLCYEAVDQMFAHPIQRADSIRRKPKSRLRYCGIPKRSMGVVECQTDQGGNAKSFLCREGPFVPS